LSDLIPKICEAIYIALRGTSTPTTVQQWHAISNTLYQRWQFPNALGALDGKHILMIKPYHARSYYRNYKGNESILMAMCYADYRYVVQRYVCILVAMIVSTRCAIISLNNNFNFYVIDLQLQII
jgi:hypothetical protein